MRTFKNYTGQTKILYWCSWGPHYIVDQRHVMPFVPSCKIQSHTIEPNSAITIDDTSVNGDEIEQLAIEDQLTVEM